MTVLNTAYENMEILWNMIAVISPCDIIQIK